MPKHYTIISGAQGWLGNAILSQLGIENAIPLISKRNEVSTVTERSLVADLSLPNAPAVLEAQYHDLPPAQIFIHCAGLAHQAVETDETSDKMWRINDRGTANAISFCQNVGIQRFIYISTIAGYDWPNKRSAKECDDLLPRTAYAESKLAGERRACESPLDGRVVRLATVFGTGDRANFFRLSQSLRTRKFVLPGGGLERKSAISVDLAAKLIAFFAMMEKPKHRLINLALPEAPTLAEICDAFHKTCGYPKPISLPKGLLRALALLGDQVNRVRPFPLTSDALRKLNVSTWVDTKRMQELFPEVVFPNFAESLAQHSQYYCSH